MPWDPDKYNQFQAQRSAPFEDLFGLIRVRPGMRVIDLGCGTGELTQRLADCLPDSQVLGIDSSPEMLARAERQPGQQARPGLQFKQEPIEQVSGEWDLIFSNAALQWVDDHAALIPRLIGMLRPGGQIVAQVPSNHNHPVHSLIVATAREEPFRHALYGWTRKSPVLTIESYAELLYTHAGRDLVVIEKVYPHILADAGALADWSAGTALVPYLDRLKPELHEPFLACFRQKLFDFWPESPIFYGFRHILFAARLHGDGPEPA